MTTSAVLLGFGPGAFVVVGALAWVLILAAIVLLVVRPYRHGRARRGCTRPRP